MDASQITHRNHQPAILIALALSVFNGFKNAANDKLISIKAIFSSIQTINQMPSSFITHAVLSNASRYIQIERMHTTSSMLQSKHPVFSGMLRHEMKNYRNCTQKFSTKEKKLKKTTYVEKLCMVWSVQILYRMSIKSVRMDGGGKKARAVNWFSFQFAWSQSSSWRKNPLKILIRNAFA